MPRSSDPLADLQHWFSEQCKRLWPAGLGSLSLRKSPCLRREHCHACQTGEQHPSYVLYGRRNGRRRAIYIPDRLVPEVQRLLANGRALQTLLYEAAGRYVEALKGESARRR